MVKIEENSHHEKHLDKKPGLWQGGGTCPLSPSVQSGKFFLSRLFQNIVKFWFLWLAKTFNFLWIWCCESGETCKILVEKLLRWMSET